MHWFALKVQEVHDGDTLMGAVWRNTAFQVGKANESGLAPVLLSVVPVGKLPVYVRLRNIDAPELKQAFGEQARTYLANLLPINTFAWCRIVGKEVIRRGIKYRDFSPSLDKYGRYLCDISLKPESLMFGVGSAQTVEKWFYSFESGEAIDEHLVKNGMAWHYTQYSQKPALSLLQQQAQNAKLGLWDSATPIAPWVFRKL